MRGNSVTLMNFYNLKPVVEDHFTKTSRRSFNDLKSKVSTIIWANSIRLPQLAVENHQRHGFGIINVTDFPRISRQEILEL